MTTQPQESRNIVEMSVQQFGSTVLNYYKSMKPQDAKTWMCIGPVGCGKTEIWRDVIGKGLGIPVIMRHLSQIHPLDFGGVIANPQTRALEFAKSPLVQEVEDAIKTTDHKRALLVFDELDRVQAIALNSCLQVLSERRQNGFAMGDVYIGAAGNGWHDLHTFELSKAALSRLNVVSVEPKVDEWLRWAANHKVDTRIIMAISLVPDILNQHTELPGTVWKAADPRAWYDLSRALAAGFPIDDAGAFIGKHAAVTFQQYSNFTVEYQKAIDKVVQGNKVPKSDLPAKNADGALFAIYLAAAGQIKTLDAVYDYLKNSMTQIGNEKAYIASKLITYNIPVRELTARADIQELHLKLYQSSVV